MVINISCNASESVLFRYILIIKKYQTILVKIEKNTYGVNLVEVHCILDHLDELNQGTVSISIYFILF